MSGEVKISSDIPMLIRENLSPFVAVVVPSKLQRGQFTSSRRELMAIFNHGNVIALTARRFIDHE